MASYYYEQAGQPAGPLPVDQLAAHGVRATTMVWQAGMTDWVPAATLPALAALFPPPPPPPVLAPAANAARPAGRIPAQKQPLFTGKKLIVAVVGLLALGLYMAGHFKPRALASKPQVHRAKASVQAEEIKEIGYAYNHRHDEDDGAAREEPVERSPESRAPAREDAIESIDNDDGSLTIQYASGATRGASLGDKKNWLFAYSPHLIVLHNERVGCSVRDIRNDALTERNTRNDGACTGLRVTGDNIVIDVDNGYSTHQETYDKHLNLLRTSPSHRY